MAYIWPALAVVLAIHEEQIAEHGGSLGLRDPGRLDAALHRPLNYLSFGDEPDIALLAAVLVHGLVSNHPFIDGNKRASLVVTELFLELNGYELAADDAAAVTTWLDLAQGNIDEQALAAWIRERIKPRVSRYADCQHGKRCRPR
jgi:death on curing protein